METAVPRPLTDLNERCAYRRDGGSTGDHGAGCRYCWARGAANGWDGCCHGAGRCPTAAVVAGMVVAGTGLLGTRRIVTRFAARRGRVAHLGCAVRRLAVGLLRLPIRQRLRRLAVLGRGLAWLPVGLLRLAVGLLRALVVWGGHATSLDLL